MGARFSEDGLVLDGGTTIPLYAGEFHYWRHEASLWPKALSGLKELGLSIVSTYVPWSVHELRPGSFDFKGDRDLGAFLDLCHEMGLYALVRPGPHINAELTHFGFPERILGDAAMQARSASGTPVWLPAPPKMFPVPSYASAAFRSEVATWFAALGKIVAPRVHPAGPVVALQVDNEMQLFWRLGAFESDYHPEALEWWREYSDDKPAPTEYRPESMSSVLEWLRFKEHYVSRSLRWLSEELVAAGLGDLPRYHNLPPTRPTLANLPEAAEAIDGVAGMDFYDLQSGYARVRERAIYLASSSALPFAPELGMGGPPWLPPMGEEDQRNVLLGALAGGVRAFNLYMAVERERWYGGLLDASAEPRPSAEWLASLLRALREHEFHLLRRRAPIALIVSRAEERAAIASCALDSASACVTELVGLGPSGHAELAMDASARAYPRWVAAVRAALELADLPYQLIDESALHRLDRDVRAVVIPTLRRVDGGVWAALHTMSAAGMPIVLGPELPIADELDRALGEDASKPARVGMIAAESLGDPEGLAEALLALAGPLDDLWIAPEDPALHCSCFEDGQARARLVFVGNQSDAEALAKVNAPEGARLRDVISGEEVQELEGLVSVPLAPFQVRCFAVC